MKSNIVPLALHGIASEIAAGDGINLTETARRFPSARQGRPMSSSCVLRWILKGVKTLDGERVRLEAALVSGRWLTTPAAIERFIIAQQLDLDGQATSARTPTRRQRESAKASATLKEKWGI